MMEMHSHNVQHDKWHMHCCWKPMLGKLIWTAAFLSFVGGLVAFYRGGEFWSVSAMTWYWTALVGGVLAVGIRGYHSWCGCDICHGMGQAQKQ